MVPSHGGTVSDAEPDRRAAVDLLRTGRAVLALHAVPIWTDGGDLHAVLSGAEWWRHVSHRRPLARMVPRGMAQRADGRYTGGVLTLDGVGERGQLIDGRDLRGRGVGVPATVSGRRPRFLPGRGEPGDAQPAGRLRYRARLPILWAATGPAHVCPRRAADLDATLRAPRDVRRRQPLRQVLGGGGS